jgi:Tat protein secretion system quality control protein TatD with DNase activity
MIRRALLKQWPALARFYGIHPWDAERFTLDELNEYLRQLDEHHRQQRLAAQQAKRQTSRRR